MTYFAFMLSAVVLVAAQTEASTDSSPSAASTHQMQQIPQVLSHEIQAFGLGAAGTAGLLWLGNRKQRK